MTDLSQGDATRAKSYLPFLQRQGRMRAIVEYVFAGGRVKLYIPKENCATMFALAGMRCPLVGKAVSDCS